ncbi:MAG: T9SS type A sorting domain-containing protein [Bacteroidota bacterium]
MNRALLFTFILLHTIKVVHAQFNPSFEQFDSLENLMGWKIQSGSAKRQTVQLINNIPFSATHGNYFLQLTNDTLSLPRATGQLTNRFAFTDTPYSLYFDAFMIPSFANDVGSVSILFKTSTGDTVLWAFDTLKPVTQPGNPSQILLKWNAYAVNLASSYRSAQRPDSCVLTITNSTLASGFATFFIDNLRFSSFAVGNPEKHVQSMVNVFPNPSAGAIRIEGLVEPCFITVYDLNGLKVMSTETAEPIHILNLNDANTGMYLMNISGPRTNVYRKICISH